MDRKHFVLSGMSPAGNSPFSPVQVQKLFFLLDRNIPNHTGGPHFAFEPYDYGPFDKQVYHALEDLTEDGLIEIANSHWRSSRAYRLTDKGHAAGRTALDTLPASVQAYVNKIVYFVRSRSFTQLVSTIYEAYPDMRANSVFVQRSQ